MKILVTGSSGLVGTALIDRLKEEHHEPTRLVRHAGKGAAPQVMWQPDDGILNPKEIAGFDAVINLAGESISDGRWTEEKKRRIRDSRVNGTRLLCETLAELSPPPRVLISASAMGYYGDRGKQVLDEDSARGEGFLADVCRDWEVATEPAKAAGIRVVNFRIGLVLSEKGGALPKMLMPFKFGLGGVVGSGEQYMSWITLDDLVSAIIFCIEHKALSGPVNGMTPNPISNKKFTQALGKALHRPAFMPLPAFMVKTLMGEMGEELLLSSTRALPQRLIDHGFQFQSPTIQEAFASLLR